MKSIKKTLVLTAIIIVLLCLLAVGASAYNGTEYGSTGMYYKISNGEVTITDANNDIVTANIPESIDEYPVTSIGYYAFSGCTELTSLTIPDSVTNIGDYAFQGCSGLTKINWNAENVKGFSEDSCVFTDAGTSGDGIDVVFSDNVKVIDGYAFAGANVKSVIIGNSVTSIGDGAFSGCTRLTSITIPDSVTNIGVAAFSHCSGLTSVTIGSGVTSIGDFVFSGCTSLTSITIPDSVTSIGFEAFSDCTSLTSVTIPDSVTSVGVSAFSGCTSLTSVTLGANIKIIRSGTFYGCKGLENITMPQNVRVISESAFQGCSGMKTMTFESRQISIGNYAFGYDENDIPYEGFTIKGYEHSSAEVYALLNGFDFVSLDKEEHVHFYTVKTYVQPSCLSIGYEVRACSCGDTYTVTLPALGHTDEDNDGICDRCEEKLAAQPEEPTEPDTPSDDKNNDDDNSFVAFFKQIIELLKKLFNLLGKRALRPKQP